MNIAGRIAIFLFAVPVFAAIFAIEANCAEEKQGKVYAEWREWIRAKQDYLGSIELRMKDGRDMAILQAAGLNEAVRNKDEAAGEKVIADTSKRLYGIVEDLKAITPPPEFKEYHEKVIDSYRYRQMANEATLNKDMIKIRDNGRRAAIAEIEALQCIRQLYIKHDAPPQIIDSIDAGIAADKRAIVAR